jgi:aminomethyltransferase
MLLKSGFRAFSESAALTTPFYSLHKQYKGKIVSFAGYSLPIQYQESGILKEHLHTRHECSLFDVSHMGNFKLYGKDREAFIERFTVVDMGDLQKGESALSLIMNAKGGVVDDTIITQMNDHISLIVNGACKHKDFKYFNEKIQTEFKGKDVTVDHVQHNALLAIQGPKSQAVLQQLIPDFNLKDMNFMTAAYHKSSRYGHDIMISRCGYTGEDGFEINMPEEMAEKFANDIIELKVNGEKCVKMAGLGCRDTLRLEGGLCLYGHELNETIGPVESGLMWVMTKNRKANGGFLGFDRMKSELEFGVQRRRCGFYTEGMAAREQCDIYQGDKIVGKVTSGTFSPSLKKPIGMAYIDVPLNKPGVELKVKVGSRMQKLKVAKLPFLKLNYYKKA